ncbi:MAG TPA: filamentous hemagglutinin N-terminal domain-containing protein, partial [Chlamydiales bacterium]|nr:filamentous hemagglutinin N-terminal domain-containing protein [Chlamydiales bacterium]
MDHKGLSLFIAAACSCIIFASPSGHQIKHGKASLWRTPDGMTIQTGKRTIIHWDQFNISKNETVRFNQFNKNSTVLNRVTGCLKSELLGQLLSNGSVWLINPHGILVGQDAIINTAGFLASTLDLLDQEFIQGGDINFFNPGEGNIINLGRIESKNGDVTLLSQIVHNAGEIKSNHVAIGSAAKLLLKLEGKQRIFIDTSVTLEDGTIEHDGKIKALITEIKSGSLYEQAICSRGNIDALQIEERSGEVYLAAPHGTTLVNGEINAPGGRVEATGHNTVLGDDAKINVSDLTHPGKIYIGGGLHGDNPNICNAATTVIWGGAQIHADAIESGNGGEVVVWSDDITSHFGFISARGGSQSGNGGFVEISGREGLRIQTDEGSYNTHGKVIDLTAPFGKTGELLLDPKNITIQNGGTDSVYAGSYFC